MYFPQLAITKHLQREDYTFNQFFSELGGAAGLVLGVSLISIVRVVDLSISMLVRKLQIYCKTYYLRKEEEKSQWKSESKHSQTDKTIEIQNSKVESSHEFDIAGSHCLN